MLPDYHYRLNLLIYKECFISMVNIFCKLISLSLRNILFWDRLWIKISLWHYVKCYINESCHNPSFYSELRLDRHTEIAGWLITNGSQERLGACLKVNKILHLILISLGWQSQSQFLTDKNRIMEISKTAWLEVKSTCADSQTN